MKSDPRPATVLTNRAIAIEPAAARSYVILSAAKDLGSEDGVSSGPRPFAALRMTGAIDAVPPSASRRRFSHVTEIGLLAVMLVLYAGRVTSAGEPAPITTARIPAGGLQPQAAVDASGVIHLIYLKGAPDACDVYYVRSADGANNWSVPLRVNSDAGSAIAIGTVRGAHLALGPGGQPHVAWMGSAKALPRGPGNATPMLYARLAEGGKSFEPQRNVIAQHVGLDGGGSVAVDARNRVYVGWHAPAAKGGEEATRAVWVARSDDGGKTFAPEYAFSPDPTGTCGCCGMRLFARGDTLVALYRSATEAIHRDIYVVSQTGSAEPAAQKVAAVIVPTCVMSTAAMADSPAGVTAAWETDKQIQWGVIDTKTGKLGRSGVHLVGGTAQGGRKHPSVAVDAKGRTLIAWAEGTGWQKGGNVAWKLFDATGKAVEGAAGKAENLPAWSLPAAVARPDGTFVVLY
jgi:hypothetical protein